MIICGIDPGTRFTGFGVLETGSATDKHIAHGTLSPKGDDLSLRLKEIYLGLVKVFETYQPAEVAVETSFYAKNAQTALKLGQVRGVIFLAAAMAQIPIFEYSPSEIKKAVCGYGQAEKEQVSTMVKTILHLGPDVLDSLDASDALATCICHASSRKFRRL